MDAGTQAEVHAALRRVRERDVDRDFLAQEHLDVVSKDRVSAFPWRGQFTPSLVRLLLESYGRSGATVLDPFAGSGTTLVEAARRGMAAIGAEVNPAALELASVFTLAGENASTRKQVLSEVRRRLESCLLHGDSSLFGAAPTDLKADLLRAYKTCSNPYAANLVAVSMMLAMGDSRSLSQGRLHRALGQVSQVVGELPPGVTPCSVYASDARELPLPEDAADLILTSPPYINVFNYHQNYRPAIEALGWDVLSAARSEIGSNRKHRQNRFLTVIQYAMDMMQALEEFNRVCRPSGHVVIVVGRESNVRRVAFANGEIVGCLTELIPGFDFVRWQERSFVNRFGERIYEEVLTFKVVSSKLASNSMAKAAEVGRQVLLAARPQAESDTILGEIEDAISQTDKIQPSRKFVPTRAGVSGESGS